MQDLMRASFTRLQVGALLTSPYGHTAVQSSDFGFGICCGALQMPQERVQIWMREIWCSFLSTYAFLLGNGQTYATLGVPYYRVSRIFMSHIFYP